MNALHSPDDARRMDVPSRVTPMPATRITVTLSAHLMDRLQELARQQDVGIAVPVLSGWAMTLRRWGVNQGAVFEILINRSAAGTPDPLMVSKFHVPAALVRDDVSVAEVLQQAATALARAYARMNVLQAESSDAGTSGAVTISARGLQFPDVIANDADHGAAELHLTLHECCVKPGESLSATVDWQGGALAPEILRQMVTSWQMLMEGMAGDLRCPIERLPLLSASERNRVLCEFNDTAWHFQPDVLLHELFTPQVARTPNAIALISGEEEISFTILERRANQLAHHLQKSGVGPERLVGIHLERSVDMIVALLAVLKAGGAYLPLDPAYPGERLSYILADASPCIVLTNTRLGDLLPQSSAQVLKLDRIAGELEMHSPTAPPHIAKVVTPVSLAYVLYTSGSTGKPKGIAAEHRNVVNRVLAQASIDPFSAWDVCCQKTSIGFVDHVFEVFGPLAHGRPLVIAPPSAARSVEHLVALVDRRHITRLISVPSLAVAMLDIEGAAEALRTLRSWTLSGEELQPALLRKLHAVLPDCTIVNLYGSSEVTADATYHVSRHFAEGRVPIGRPIANTRIYILDQCLEPLPVGAAGEICVAGAGVARGYVNRPDLTAERFICDAFNSDAQARMYRSGDIGRWRPDGTIEYLGRSDHQVKIRGYRIELGEIERQLLGHPHVREAAVVTREDGSAEKRLVAYVTRRDESTIDCDGIRAYLRRVLPEYMVPGAIVIRERLPLTVSGKVDRMALPAPDLSAYATSAYEAPQGGAESLLAAIWQELLAIERVGRHDNFFQLGGHSLLIVQMLQRLRAAGYSLSAERAFEIPTLAALAAALNYDVLIERKVPPNLIPEGCGQVTPEMLPLVQLDPQNIEHIVEVVPGGAANVQDIYPLAPLQEGIFFHHLMTRRTGDIYVRPLLLSIDSRSRLDELISAARELVRRHDVLRTAVLWESLPQPLQVVLRRADLTVEELRPVAEHTSLDTIRVRMAPKHQVMDVRSAPLMRLTIIADSHTERWYALLQTHHLVFDDESLDVMLAELAAYMEGRGHELPPPVPYRNHVAEALAYAASRDAERFFRQKLGDVSETTAPFGIVEVHGDAARIEVAELTLDPQLSKLIRASARQAGVSCATLFHAAWALVIAHTSGRDDVVFGSVLLGRMHGSAGAQRILGMFINTLPLRLALANLSVKELLHRTRQELIELLSHEQASLAAAQRCSGIPGTAPLFTALLNYLHGSATLGSTTRRFTRGVDVMELREWTNYPVALSVVDMAEQFALTMQTDNRIDPERTLEYTARALRVLVDALDREPYKPALALTILPPTERHTVLEAFNATAADWPRNALVHELFEQQVLRSATAVALVSADQQITYEELNRRGNQLASVLLDRGVRANTRVAIYMERTVDMVVALLATLKAGGAYVPLDTTYPSERLLHILRDSKPRVLLTQHRLRTTFDPDGIEVIDIEAGTSSASNPAENPDPAQLGLDPAHPAYIIYTSGSTGAPKGVVVAHRNLVNLIEWHCRAFDVKVGWRNSCLAALGFDAAVWEIWPTLSAGGTVVLAPPPLSGDMQGLLAWWSQQRLDFSFMPTPVAELALSQHIGNETLRWLFIGGDRLRQSSGELPFTLINGYGPTECTVIATSGVLSAHDPVLHIGRPLANTRIYILDRGLQPAPLGVAGEVYIGGAGVALGYLNRPELTAQRFIADPFVTEPHARMYRTGDLARWRPDGTIEFLGRNDEQVKIRGFRIELGEIEAHLFRDPQLQDAVVLAREDVPGAKVLVAYVTSADGAAVDGNELRARLRAVLPEYMVPSAFVNLKTMPLTANGKIDRRALPAPDLAAYATQNYEAPIDTVEETLAGVWKDVLKIERVGRHDDFFELGGHSLLIVQMLERLRRAGLSVEVRRVFESPTLAELARALRSGAAMRSGVPANEIPRGCRKITPQMLTLIDLDETAIERIVAAVPDGAVNVQDIYPLTPLQHGMLFHHLLGQRGSDAYVSATLLRVASRERLEQLIAALQWLTTRHDMLRTAVLWEDLPQPVQVVWRHSVLPVEESVLDPDRDSLEQVHEWLEPMRQTLDLRRAPLMRIRVAADVGGAPHWYALLQIHHMADDGVSQAVIISEIAAFLEARTADLPEPVAYRNHVAHVLARGRTHDAAAYFREQLGDVDEPTAPFGLINVHGDGATTVEACIEIDASLAQRIRAQARQAGVGVATLFHAGWGVVVSRTSGRDDVVFGSVLLGRLQSSEGAQRVVGMFINTLPLRLRIGRAAAQQLVEQTQQRLGELLHHEDASLAEAQRCSAVPAGAPLFSAVLNYRHGAADERAEWGAVDGFELLTLQYRTNYPISLAVDEVGAGFKLTAHTDNQVDPKRLATYLLTAMESLVKALERAEQTPAVELPVLPPDERRRVLADYNDTRVAFPHDKMLYELFEAQVLRTPAAAAVECLGRTLTFAELDSRANHLAAQLRERGVGPHQLVGLCVERSLEMLIGILGIFKAGAAYVPLDPEYPVDRLRYILNDAAPALVLTQPHLVQQLPQTSVNTIAIDGDGCWSAADSAGKARPGLALHNSASLAYVIYTSGSTGRPKGVMIEHRNVVSLWQGLERIYARSGRCDRIAVNASYNFDASVKQLIQVLSGRTLVIVPQEIRGDGAALVPFLERERIHGIDCTPAQLKNWLDAGLLERAHSLRVVLVGGEPIDPSLWRTLAEQRRTDFYDVYGPTESTVDTTFARITGDLGMPHIGWPMENRTIYILDRNRQPVPIGVVGELYIGGAGVARGYLNRAELTSERFVADPFAHEPAARIYKTGDMGRWRPDGSVESFGRNDDQVKIRGYRMELGEIEWQLLDHPSVRQAAIVAHDDGNGGRRLVAYVATHLESHALAPSIEITGASAVPLSTDARLPLIAKLRSHLQSRVPGYMVPTSWIVMHELPLTPSGKLDRRSLPAPSDSDDVGEHTEPRTEFEREVAEIWSQVLRRRVGVHDNFFDIGGHSLLATQVVVRIRSVLSIDMSMRMLFEHPTIAQLAARLEDLRQQQLLSELGEGDEETAELLKTVASMSESKVRELIQRLSIGGRS